MLKSLSIINFAVINKLSVSFHAGLNLLTGETGSGKSIIVDALGLLAGDRISTTQVRTGERLAIIEGRFEINEVDRYLTDEILTQAGIEKAVDYEILIRREINTQGRSRILIDDQSVTMATLKALQPYLVEIHGQGEQQSLFSVQSHMDLIDTFAGCSSLRRDVAEAFKGWTTASSALNLLEREAAERERASELLRYQLSEIQKISPYVGEDDKLLAERKLLTHAENLLQLSRGAYVELYESDESILSRLASIRRQVAQLTEIDPRNSNLLDMLNSAMASLTDVAETLRSYTKDIDFSPAKLGEIENRLLELERLKRKYSSNLREIINTQYELSERLIKLDSVFEREAALREKLKQADDEYTLAANRLTKCRTEAAAALEKRVMADLQHVALGGARFIVSIKTADKSGREYPKELSESTTQEDKILVSSSFYSPSGADQVEFLISVNPGEDPRPLAKVASGGELSRLMLTLRTVNMNKDGKIPMRVSETMVFDEIDVGIGGRVAEAVGRRLKALAATRQVLCVTHQPQIARFADHHYAVEKNVEGGRTMTTIKELNRDERISELARMIGGANQSTKTREVALWLLESAHDDVAQPVRSRKSRKAEKKIDGKKHH